MGETYLIIYGDIDGKGPSENDLIGRSEPFVIQQQNIDLSIAITKEGDISPLQFPSLKQQGQPEIPPQPRPQISNSPATETQTPLGYANPLFIEVADSYEYPNSSLITKSQTPLSDLQKANSHYKKEQFTEAVKLRFDKEGISIPFPQMDVHLHKDASE